MALVPHRPRGSVSQPFLLGVLILVIAALGLLAWVLLSPGARPDRDPSEVSSLDPPRSDPTISLNPAREDQSPAPADPMPVAASSAGTLVVERGAGQTPAPSDPRQPAGGTTYTLTGQVLDRASGKPVVHFGVYLLPASAGDIRLAKDSNTPNLQARNQQGKFELLFQPPGIYNVLVDTITHKDLVVEGVRIPQDQELVLQLEKGTWLHGRVTDDLGTPLDKYPVLLHPVQIDGGRPAPRRTRATTDALGAFQFDKLPAGTYWLSAGALGNPDAVTEQFYLGTDQALERSFRIPRLVTVKVLVETEEKTPIPRARVSLLPVVPPAETEAGSTVQLKAAYTDREGKARLPFVREGNYRLLIQFNQFVTHEEELFISEGNPYLELTRTLQRQAPPGR